MMDSNQGKGCESEEAVLRAFHSGRLSPDLTSHAGNCEWCSASLRLAQTLLQDEEDVTVPPQGLVYWKAKLRQRREQREQALQPAIRMEVAAAVLVLVVPAVAAASAGLVLAAVAVGAMALTAAATVFVLKRRLD